MVEIAGNLSHLLEPKAFPQVMDGIWGAMVAEVRSGQYPTLRLACLSI